MSRKSGTGGGGWVHPKDANSMAMSGLAHGWSRVYLNGPRKQSSHLV